ncbi:hypothetical protein CGMCC3_g3155 [Colletotrichum fructicola]|nr:uncharacterized protein CGMCC3_g3155 [Colletotrichum fructicola]KAE9580797.1 hypothetical protein CGMCC3_g3155 [Colletotrichum fructicola]
MRVLHEYLAIQSAHYDLPPNYHRLVSGIQRRIAGINHHWALNDE